MAETETISEHLLHAEIENLRVLSTQKLAFIISRRHDFDVVGNIIVLVTAGKLQ